jgi:MFS family permease
MSRIFAAYSAGTLLGPALGLLEGIRAPFGAYLLLVAAGSALVPVMEAPAVRLPLRADRSALRVPGFWASAVGILFAVLALGVVEGVLPLHFDLALGQRGIALLFVAVALVHASGATLAGRLRPRSAVLASAALVVGGVAAAGATGTVAAWVLALAVAAVGIGLAEVGSMGMLLESVAPERSVTAMVVWSQLGIAGYLVGPVAGGMVVDALGFAWVGLVPAAGGALLLGMVLRRRVR